MTPSATLVPGPRPRPKGAGARFFWGAGFFGRGLSFVLGHKRLWPWVLMPSLLTGAAVFFGTMAAWRWANAFIDARLAGHGAFVAALLWVVLFLFVVSMGYVAFLVTSMLATAPFAGPISERTEKLHTGQVIAVEGIGAILRNTVRGLGHTVLELSLYIGITLALLFLQLFLSPLAPFIWILNVIITGYFFAFDAYDLTLGRRGKNFGQKWAFLGAHTAEGLGFGVTIALLLVVPGLGLFVPAIAACGSTLLFLEIEAAETKPDALAAP